MDLKKAIHSFELVGDFSSDDDEIFLGVKAGSDLSHRKLESIDVEIKSFAISKNC